MTTLLPRFVNRYNRAWFAVLCAAGILALLGMATAARAQAVTAVEYYYDAWDYYFVTSNADEIALLDGGGFNGNWKRTGQSFLVGGAGTGALAPTCRFFSTSFSPRSSHFYTPFATECATIKASPDWQYEGIAFYLALADANGTCPSGTTPLYRLYNNGAGNAPNHRYTASKVTVAQMQALGWIAEGNGPDATFACLPAPVPASPATGIWAGSTGFGESVRVIILEDGTYYVLINNLGVDSSGRVIEGTSLAANGVFTSPDPMVYPIATQAEADGIGLSAMAGGSYTPRGRIEWKISDYRGDDTISATYVAGSDQSPSIASLVGSYSGYTGHTGGRRASTFTILADGTYSGSNSVGCRYKGTLTPRAGVGVFDWTWSAVNDGCYTSDATGILYYDAATRRAYGLGPFGLRQDIWYLLGTKQ